jgi:hypothetical protein
MTMRRPRRLARMVLAQLEARPGFRRAIVRSLDRMPALKRALKRELGRMRAQAAGGAAIAGTDFGPERLTARAARVLADLDSARAARATDRALRGP